MNPQLQIDFSTDRLTAIHMAVESNRERAKSNCMKLLAFWQSTNLHIDKYYAKDVLNIDCLSQRVANLRKSGVAIKDNTHDKNKGEPQSRYWLECSCAIGKCYLHDVTLKIL